MMLMATSTSLVLITITLLSGYYMTLIGWGGWGGGTGRRAQAIHATQHL